MKRILSIIFALFMATTTFIVPFYANASETIPACDIKISLPNIEDGKSLPTPLLSNENLYGFSIDNVIWVNSAGYLPSATIVDKSNVSYSTVFQIHPSKSVEVFDSDIILS